MMGSITYECKRATSGPTQTNQDLLQKAKKAYAVIAQEITALLQGEVTQVSAVQ